MLLLLLAAGCASDREYRAIDTLARDPVGPVLGRWGVQFANGVKEVCRVGEGGAAVVMEPLRSSSGWVEAQGRSFVIFYQDDRTERWTPVGKRCVVEHWFPGSAFPTATPVLGIAERLR